MPQLNFARTYRTTTRLALLSLAAIAMLIPPAYASEPPPGTQPATKPVTQPADLPKVVTPGGELLGGKPTTQPGTKPAAKVSAEARLELDAIREAYKGLKSLRSAGTLSADMDLNGLQRNIQGEFASAYQSPGQEGKGIGKFRLVTRDGLKEQAKEAQIIGSTGAKLYVYEPANKCYMTADAPKTRGPGATLDKTVKELLEGTDASLLMALVNDASVEILDGVASAEKGEVILDGVTYTSLELKAASGSEVRLLLDPKTHLVRQIAQDLRKGLEKSGQQEVKKALITVRYSTVEPDADVSADAFAWTPPEGAKEVASGAAVADAGDDEGDAAATALEGKPAPEFRLAGLDGKEVALADLRGSVVVLDFWATWCGPCRASLPHLGKLYDEKKEAGLKAFALDLREKNDAVQAFVTQTKLSVPVLLDTDGKVAGQYGVSGIPQTVVIGKDGTIRKVFVGSGTHEQIRRAVEEAMK